MMSKDKDEKLSMIKMSSIIVVKMSVLLAQDDLDSVKINTCRGV